MAHASTQTDSVVSLAKSKVERGTHSTRLHRNSKVASSGKVGQYKAGCPLAERETEEERKDIFLQVIVIHHSDMDQSQGPRE